MPAVMRLFFMGAAAVVLAACATPEAYVPKPLDTSAPAVPSEMILAREWRLDDLTLQAIRHGPDMAVARARLEETAATADAAVRHAFPSLEASGEHHSLQDTYRTSPWALGFALNIPLLNGRRSEAEMALRDARVREAQLDYALAVWKVRAEVRQRWVEALRADRALQMAQREADLCQERQSLMAKRFELNAIARADLAASQRLLDDAERQLAQARRTRSAARSALGALLGLAPQAASNLVLSSDAAAAAPARPEVSQEQGLKNRLDVQRALQHYAVAEDDYQLEVAKQYPDLTLRPGYFWDQTDNRFALGFALPLPIPRPNAGGIAAAIARRETAGREFMALQFRAIHDIADATTAAHMADDEWHHAQDRAARRQRELQDGQVLFDKGQIDRVEWIDRQRDLNRAASEPLQAWTEWMAAAGRLEDAVQKPLIDEVAP
jgi:cobalt-zinc-cadmium efflux system outer membrane protein